MKRKEDIVDLRKSFRVNDGSSFIDSISNYIVRINPEHEQNTIISENHIKYSRLGEVESQYFLNGLKKVLSGSMYVKNFDNPMDCTSKNKMYSILSDLSDKNAQKEFIDKYVQQDFTEKSIINITFITTGVCVLDLEEKEDKEYNSSAFSSEKIHFVLFSDVKYEKGKFKYNPNTSEKIKMVLDLNPTLKVDSPFEGFMYPNYIEKSKDVNSILYYRSKKNDPNNKFITFLGGKILLTEQEERYYFNRILSLMFGGRINVKSIKNLFYKIKNQSKHADRISSSVLGKLISEINSDFVMSFNEAFQIALKNNENSNNQDEIDYNNYEFKIENIIPREDMINIYDDKIGITLRTEELDNVEIIKENGNSYIKIKSSDELSFNNTEIKIISY